MHKTLTKFELKIPPPVIAFVCAVIMYLLARYLPLKFVVPGGKTIFYFLFTVGVLIAVYGVVLFRGARTTIHPNHPQQTSQLVISGIYQYTRNPMYLGMLIVLVGWAIYLGSLFSLVGVPLFVVLITQLQILPEERILKQKFGLQYEQYLMTVRRWL